MWEVASVCVTREKPHPHVLPRHPGPTNVRLDDVLRGWSQPGAPAAFCDLVVGQIH
jgi:hypothetical protein